MRKVVLTVTAALLLCGTLASCAGKINTVSPEDKGNDIPTVSTAATASHAESGNESVSENDVTDTAKYSLDVYDGWWHHIGGNVGGDAVVDVFMVDAASGTWTEYGLNGIAGGTYTCYADKDGIHMDYGDIGETVLYFDGVGLLNFMGYLEYMPGDPIEEVSPSAYEGAWYELGDKDGRCLTVSGDTYILDQVSGGWDTAEVETTADDMTVNELRMKLLDHSGAELVVTDKGCVLYDPEKGTAYIKESVLGTSEGDDLVRKYDLICNKWQCPGEDMPAVEFGYYGNKFYLVNVITADGKTEVIREACGTWSIHEYELSLHYSDGHEEITPYDPESLRFSYYNMSFDKVKG